MNATSSSIEILISGFISNNHFAISKCPLSQANRNAFSSSIEILISGFIYNSHFANSKSPS